ncbi:MAG: hypothetical protein ACQEST_05515 [Bacteroidota bacterium]
MKSYKLISVTLLCLAFLGCKNSPESGLADNPASPNSLYPYLFSTDNELYMSWISENDDSSHSLNYARYAEGSWSEATTIASDSTWFVNWADFPSIIADENGPVAAHWLNKKPGGTYAYDVNISAADSLENWNSAIVPHDDSTATEHGFASMIPWENDTILAVWLDGRKTDGRSDDEYFDLDYAMTLRGAIIDRDGEVLQDFLIDDTVCDCCPTSLIKTEKGAMVAYRNRTNNEVRDIYTSQFDGKKWSNPKTVYEDDWEIGACPVNGPKLAAEDSLVALAWHTGANDEPTSKFSYSTDGGDTFEDPTSLNSDTSLGRVDIEVVNGEIFVSWMEKNEKETVLNLASFDRNQQIQETQKVTALDESRNTGFPQMEQLNGNLIFAWTNIDSSDTHIITEWVSIN